MVKRPEKFRKSQLQGHDVPVVVCPLPRDGRSRLIDELISSPTSAESLVPKAEEGRTFVNPSMLGIDVVVVARGQGDSSRLVEEADDKDAVVHGRGVLWQWQCFVDSVRHGGLSAVEHEDVFVVFLNCDARLASVEGFREELRHFQESTVVVGAPVAARIDILLSRVGGSNVGTLAPVVPRDDLDEVGLEFEEMQPFVYEDSIVLLVGPVHVCAKALEKPRCNGRNPLLAGSGAITSKVGVNLRFFLGSQVGVDPGKDAVGGLGGGESLASGFGESARDK